MGPPPVSLSSIHSNYIPPKTYGKCRQHPGASTWVQQGQTFHLICFPHLIFLQKDNVPGSAPMPSPSRCPVVPAFTVTLYVISPAADSRDLPFSVQVGGSVLGVSVCSGWQP